MSSPHMDATLLDPALGLGRVVSLAEVRDVRDDWTGVTGTAERRRRQNRLNQRAYRKRKQGIQSHASASAVEAPTANHKDLVSRHQLVRSGEHGHATSEQNSAGQGFLLHTCPRQRDMIRAFMRSAYKQYSLNAPQPTHLPMLIRLNVLNALSRNAAMIGFPPDGLCHDEYISPFNEQGPRPANAVVPPSCAKSLRPTALQIAVTHHPWIDLFPIPQMRDNMINGIVAEIFDEDELCADLLNVEDNDRVDKPSLIVWGMPWDPCGWEVSVAFLRKWGWLVRGCDEIVDATNSWRQKRGEKALNFG